MSLSLVQPYANTTHLLFHFSSLPLQLQIQHSLEHSIFLSLSPTFIFLNFLLVWYWWDKISLIVSGFKFKNVNSSYTIELIWILILRKGQSLELNELWDYSNKIYLKLWYDIRPTFGLKKHISSFVVMYKSLMLFEL